MHDILERVAFKVALLNYYLIITSKKFCALDDLNTAISLFHNGPMLAFQDPSRSSAISSAKLKIDSLGLKTTKF